MHEKRVLPTSSVELQTAPVPHGVGFPAAISVGMRLFSGYREMWWFFEILSTYILNYHTDRWYLGSYPAFMFATTGSNPGDTVTLNPVSFMFGSTETHPRIPSIGVSVQRT